jgi:hypothetical protein
MNDFQPRSEVREEAIKAGYDLIAKQLDKISEELDATPISSSGSINPDAAVEHIQKEVMDKYRSLHGSDERAYTKFTVLQPKTPHSYAEVVELGMNTLGDYLKEAVPILEEANAPLTTLSHPNSLKVIALMMRANLERDEFQNAIMNLRENIQVSSEGSQPYLEIIPGSFLEFFLRAMDPEKRDTITANHTQLVNRLVSTSLPEKENGQRIWSIASSLGSIYLYNPQLYSSEINSDRLEGNIDSTLSLEDLASDEEVLQAVEESSDFELFARIKPHSPLATWLFPEGMPSNPIDRYEQSIFKLFGTVSYTKTRFCPAGRSLMQLFTGKSPEHNITVTYINRFISLVGSTPL